MAFSNIFKDEAFDKSCMCNSLSVKSDKWEMTNEMLASSLFILIKCLNLQWYNTVSYYFMSVWDAWGNLDFVNGKLAAQTLFSEALAASSSTSQLPKNKNSSEMLDLTHTF